MALALDGSVHGNASPATSLTVVLSTTGGNDIICVVSTVNGGPVTGVTGGGLSFSRRTSTGASSSQVIELWTAVAASPLSTTSLTVNQTSNAFITVDAFGISGANTAATFDPNGSLPGVNSGSGGVTISTSNANDMLLELARNPLSPIFDSGFTSISSNDFQGCAYKVVSVTQSGLALNVTSNTGLIGDAIKAAPPIGFRKTLSPIGTRAGTRQTQVWGD